MSEKLITKIVGEFDPVKPLPLNDRRYVECSAERGSVGLLDSMARAVRRSAESTCQLFCGHRGCGKTTELYRLQRDLTFGKQRQFVIYCEADKYLDLNDVEYTDVLLAIVQQLWQDAYAQGVQLKPGKLEALFTGIADIFKGLRLKEAEIEVSVYEFLKGKLTAEFKNSSDIRHLVRSYLRDRTPTFLEAANELIRFATGNFRDKGYDGLVIIVDNLDRVYLKPVSDANRNSHEALFLDAGDHLRGLACDVIYTIPPTLYSLYGGRLEAIYGSQPKMLPMIPVTKYGGGEDKHGIAKLTETVDKRLKEAGTVQREAFDSAATIKRLCVASGGHMRRLMTLMRAVCNNIDQLPISCDVVEHAIRDTRDGFIASIRNPSEWEMLRQIAESKEVTEPETCARLLDNFAILEYRDDKSGPWHDVNPVIREARQFKT